MKYPYAVKANGKWYQPNEEIPEKTTVEVPAENVTAIDDKGNETPLTEIEPETKGETVTAEVEEKKKTSKK